MKTLLKVYSFILILFFFYSNFLFADITRKSAVAGSFYPEDPLQLSEFLDELLSGDPAQKPDGEIDAIMVPHAGYRFSAQTAAQAYKCLKGNTYDFIIVMAPSHRDPFYGATVYNGDMYETPLGNVNIDKSVANEIVEKSEFIQFSILGHREEHAIEVQLPFIQKLFPKTPIVPIVVGGFNWEQCKSIGDAIFNTVKNKNVLIVASTDLYHGQSYKECNKTDKNTLDAIMDLKPKRLCEGLLNDKFQACGGAPVVIMQVALQQMGEYKATLQARTNSNDVMGVKEGYVVGYGAIVFSKSTLGKIEYHTINQETQKELLKIARESILGYMRTGKLTSFEPKTDEMTEKRGVFVTLTIDGMLRGCIGQHESDRPLNELVPHMAVSAAFGDPRFAPLTPDEFDKIHIKISVYLSNVYKINSITEFKMGKQGIILIKDGKRATYLPEVPIEAGWKTVDEEMSSLCRKAGLDRNAWKDGAEFWVYKTQVFEE